MTLLIMNVSLVLLWYQEGSTVSAKSISLCVTTVDCGALASPANGSVDVSGETVYGSMATFKCNVGYRLVGSATKRCTEIGQWGPQGSVQCVIIGELLSFSRHMFKGTTS